VTGIVTRDKAAKTRRVEVTRLVRHPRYGKILRRRTVCTAHDEENVSHAGDLVEIEESRPLSRTKRWRLLRVVVKSQTGLPAAPGAEAAGPAVEADKVV
jgi:small subunit ribosomal protein S17